MDRESLEDVVRQSELLLQQAHFPTIDNNYNVVFYDQGRLVCFESKSQERDLKEKSPLIATAINPNNPNDIYKKPIQFYFYMSKDSNELKPMY